MISRYRAASRSRSNRAAHLRPASPSRRLSPGSSASRSTDSARASASSGAMQTPQPAASTKRWANPRTPSNDRQAHRGALEDFRRHHGSKGLRRPEMNQTDVGAGQDRRNVPPRQPAGEDDVVELPRRRRWRGAHPAALRRRPAGRLCRAGGAPSARPRPAALRRGRGPDRSFHSRRRRSGPATPSRAATAGSAGRGRNSSRSTPFMTTSMRARSTPRATRPCRYPSPTVTTRAAARQGPCAMAPISRRAARDRSAPTAATDSGHRSRISSTSGHPCQRLASTPAPGAERLRRGCDHDVGTGLQQTAQRRRCQVRQPARDPFPQPAVRRQPRQHAHDANAVHLLDLPRPVAVTGIDDAPRMVGGAGNHRHVMAGRRPAPAVRVGTRRRRVALRREVVREEQDAHSGELDANRTPVARPHSRPTPDRDCVARCRTPGSRRSRAAPPFPIPTT